MKQTVSKNSKSCGLLYHVVLWMDTNISEDLAASIFNPKT